MQTLAPDYSRAEDRTNAWMHGIGAAAALGSGSIMFWRAAQRGADGFQLVSAVVFTLSMLALYVASTAYHGAIDPLRRARLKVADHCAIYLLIAGTYTPFTLIALHGRTGWVLFGAIWALAAIGIVFKLFFTGRFRRLSTIVYIAMGWLGVVVAKPIYNAMTPAAFGWLVAGGLAYTLGTVFYVRKGHPWMHAVWHVFVVLGTACHFVAVWNQVVPRA